VPAQAIEFHGMPAMRWTSPGGAAAIATLQGAHLVSWIPAGGEEMLFVSERSAFEPGRAIRGGIPVCFPQFAERGPLVKHGFARTLPWRFEGVEEAGEGTRATFRLASTPATLALWPRVFELELVATLAPWSLHVELGVHNRGTQAFSFAAALHTYFLVADAPRVQLRGWPEDVGFAQPIDRVFASMPRSARLEEGGRTVAIEQHGFPDTVVWNPGAALAATMPDMSPQGWRRMVCVEAAAVDPPVVLPAGGSWRGGQSIGAPG
jgi:glucose-6-phosphate 1-epimerase